MPRDWLEATSAVQGALVAHCSLVLFCCTHRVCIPLKGEMASCYLPAAPPQQSRGHSFLSAGCCGSGLIRSAAGRAVRFSLRSGRSVLSSPAIFSTKCQPLPTTGDLVTNHRHSFCPASCCRRQHAWACHLQPHVHRTFCCTTSVAVWKADLPVLWVTTAPQPQRLCSFRGFFFLQL